MVREARLRKKNAHFTDLDLSEKNRYIPLTGMKEAKLSKKNDNYIILDLSEKSLYPKDIKYLIEVKFKNFRFEL